MTSIATFLYGFYLKWVWELVDDSPYSFALHNGLHYTEATYVQGLQAIADYAFKKVSQQIRKARLCTGLFVLVDDSIDEVKFPFHRVRLY